MGGVNLQCSLFPVSGKSEEKEVVVSASREDTLFWIISYGHSLNVCCGIMALECAGIKSK